MKLSYKMTSGKGERDKRDKRDEAGFAVPIVLLFLATTGIAMGSALVSLQAQVSRQRFSDDALRVHDVAVSAVELCIARLQSAGAQASTGTGTQSVSGQWQGDDYTATVVPSTSTDTISATAYLPDGVQCSVSVVFDLQTDTLSEWREQP